MSVRNFIKGRRSWRDARECATLSLAVFEPLVFGWQTRAPVACRQSDPRAPPDGAEPQRGSPIIARSERSELRERQPPRNPPQRGGPSAPAHTRKQKVKDLSTVEREKAVKPKATASPRGGVESSLRRAGRSATQVNPIRPDASASLLGNGEAERCPGHRPDTLTSRVKGWCQGSMGWLGAERHGTVIWWKQGELSLRQQRVRAVRGSVVAQASRSYPTGGKTAPAERRRVTTAGASRSAAETDSRRLPRRGERSESTEPGKQIGHENTKGRTTVVSSGNG